MRQILLQIIFVMSLLLTIGQPVEGGPPNPTSSDAQKNTAGGTDALLSTTSEAVSNTAFGYQALNTNTTGDYNTASGSAALYANTTGNNNTASGSGALYANTTGENNTANGSFALLSNTTGNFNTAIGHGTLPNNTTGNNNTASGTDALSKNSTGSRNTAFGRNALKNTTVGNNNLALGMGAGVLLTSGSGNIYLGHPGTPTESMTMRLGNPKIQDRAFVAGVAGTQVTGGSAVFIKPNGQLGVQLSSARYKQDIAPMGNRSEPLYQLRPVTFHYKEESEGSLEYGLIAEEVAKIYPDLVTRDIDGEVQGVRNEALIPLLLNELQQQHRQLSTQAEHITAHGRKMEAQARLMDAMLQQLAELKAQNEGLRAAVGQLQEAKEGQTAQQFVAIAQPVRVSE